MSNEDRAGYGALGFILGLAAGMVFATTIIWDNGFKEGAVAAFKEEVICVQVVDTEKKGNNTITTEKWKCIVGEEV